MDNKIFYSIILFTSMVFSLFFPFSNLPSKSTTYNYWVDVLGNMVFGFVILIIPSIIGFAMKKPLEGVRLQKAYVIAMLLVYCMHITSYLQR